MRQQRTTNTFPASVGQNLSKVLWHAKTTVPYYRQTLPYPTYKDEIIDLQTFRTIPLLHRSQIVSAPEKFVSSKVSGSTLIKQKTSGSSGELLTVLRTSFEATMLARVLLKLRNEWCGDFTKTKKTMFIGGPGYDTELAPTILSQDELTLDLNLVSLDADTCLDYLELIASHGSEWMTCNTTIALTLATEVWKYPSIRDRLKLKWIELLGQYVSAEDRETISASLGGRVVSHYGCWELYTIAYDRPCGHMHLLDDHVLLEIADIDTGKLEDEGEVIVTGLKHFTMPFIRYRLRDLVRGIPGQCSVLDTPMLEVLRGRVYNYIKGRHNYDGEYFFNFAFKELEDAGFPPLRQFQVRQTAEEVFVVLWTADQPPSGKMKEAMERMVQNRLGGNVHLEWKEKSLIQASRKGTVSAFVCEI